MSDGLDLQSSAVWLCSLLSATIKNKVAFDFSSSSITRIALYALFFSKLLSTQDGISTTEVGAALDYICTFYPPHYPLGLLQEKESQSAFHTAPSWAEWPLTSGKKFIFQSIKTFSV